MHGALETLLGELCLTQNEAISNLKYCTLKFVLDVGLQHTEALIRASNVNEII